MAELAIATLWLRQHHQFGGFVAQNFNYNFFSRKTQKLLR
jgi:hypothetical protein